MSFFFLGLGAALLLCMFTREQGLTRLPKMGICVFMIGRGRRIAQLLPGYNGNEKEDPSVI